MTVIPFEPTPNSKNPCVVPYGQGCLINGSRFALSMRGTVTPNTETGRFNPSALPILRGTGTLSAATENAKLIPSYVTFPHPSGNAWLNAHRKGFPPGEWPPL